MITIKRPVVHLCVSLVFVAAIAACSGKNSGTALPIPSSAPPVSSSGSTSADVFSNLKACDVLDTALQGQGFPQGTLDKAGGDNGCSSDKPQYGGAALSLQPNLGINDLNIDKSKQYAGYVHQRPAILTKNGVRSQGDCDIAIEVTKSSRALLVITLSTGTTEQACDFVKTIADKVEPQLPKGN